MGVGPRQRLAGSRRGAFTIIELLVVITIIVVVASFVIVTDFSSDSASLSSSQRIVSGVVQGARGQAILRGTKTRLLIHNDPEDLDKYLRFFGLIYADPDDPNPENPTRWIAATQGVYLPKGIFFDAERSDLRSVNWSPRQVGTLEYPRSSPQTWDDGGESFYYYDIEANGTLIRNQNSWLVLKADTLVPGGSASGYELRSVSDPDYKEFITAALILRRSGSVTLVTDPADIIN